ncbi:MAG: hypothetical protein GX628_00075 [Clostridiales bacterium]|nr:hypothetical protein [Clostridiales bacterium]
MELFEQLKELALSTGADVIGVAPIERFKDFPAQENPIWIMPEAKSMIVLGHRTMRGSLRGTEEGTFFSHYPALGLGYVNIDIVPLTARAVCRFIEDLGKEAMPIGDHFAWAATDEYGQLRQRYSVPARPGQPAPDVRLNLTKLAYLAGLGEIGWSGKLLNPKYGPRLIFGCVLTELELPASEIVAPGTVCTRCKSCASACTGGAISADESETVSLGGYTFEIGKFDRKRCELGKIGAEETEDGSYKPSKYSPFRKKPAMLPFESNDICAGRGCMRECMIQLEEGKRITNLFDVPFRRHPAWEVDWEGYNSGRIVNKTLPPNAPKPIAEANANDINE